MDRPTAPTVSDPQVCLKSPVPLDFIEAGTYDLWFMKR
jgi:hypothetical protein